MKFAFIIFPVCIASMLGIAWGQADSRRIQLSVPGFKWNLLSADILPQWRDGIATIARGEDLYLIGGWNPRAFAAPFTATTNEIWKSRDGGRTWSFFAKAGFAPRHTFVCIDSTDGHIYVIGGDQYNSKEERSEVWRSKDFATWELVSRKSPFADRMLMGGVEYKGNFYAGGGQNLPEFKTGFSDLYISKDKGITWKLLSRSLQHMGKNIVGTMCVFNGRIYQVSGGWYGGDLLSGFTYARDVYSTVDGVNWIAERPIPMPGVQYPNTVVFDNKLWCIAGSSVVSGSKAHHYNKSNYCYMDLKGEWHAVENSPDNPKTHASSVVISRKSLLMVAGNESNNVYQLVKK